MYKSLIEKEVQSRLTNLNQNSSGNWSLHEGKLHKDFVFDNFVTAFGWMTQIAIVAEKLNHHPEWFNVYNKVYVDLQTHDAGGITELDFMLAEKMEESL